MRKNIHPEYVECQVSCACGNKICIKSNKSQITIDICNECHRFPLPGFQEKQHWLDAYRVGGRRKGSQQVNF